MPNIQPTFSCSYEIDPASISPKIPKAIACFPHLAKLASEKCGWPIKGKVELKVIDSSNLDQYLIRDIQTGIKPFFSTQQWPKVKTVLDQSEKQYTGCEAGVFLNHLNLILILYNKENDHKYHEDNYKSTLFHELIHVAQVQNNKRFFEKKTQYIRTIYELKANGVSTQATFAPLLDNINLMQSVAEGQAKYLEITNKNALFPEKIEISPPKELTSSASSMILNPKLMQYLRGLALFFVYPASAPKVAEVFNHEYATEKLLDDKKVSEKYLTIMEQFMNQT